MTAPIASPQEWAELINAIYAVREGVDGFVDYLDEHSKDRNEREKKVDTEGLYDDATDPVLDDDARRTEQAEREYEEQRELEELDAADGSLDGRVEPWG